MFLFFQITHCSSDRICYPGLKYACCFFLPGIATIIGGLFMFVFLERETNYQFVHSAWHVSMALAILFLLPRSPMGDPGKISNEVLFEQPRIMYPCVHSLW